MEEGKATDFVVYVTTLYRMQRYFEHLMCLEGAWGGYFGQVWTGHRLRTSQTLYVPVTGKSEASQQVRFAFVDAAGNAACTAGTAAWRGLEILNDLWVGDCSCCRPSGWGRNESRL